MSDIEGKAGGYERIRAKKSLKEILEVATSFEESARDFYTALIPKVGKNFRWVVEELAAEEQAHYELFRELSRREDLESQIRSMVDTPASDTRFSDAVHIPDLGDSPDDQAVLQYAMGREHIAMEQYRALADTAGTGPIKDLFAYLADEETKHKQELEKLYYETVHSGGV